MGHAQQGKSGKWYEVLPYHEQKRKSSFTPRGICQECESNPQLRVDNCVREHNCAPYIRCKGSSLPSLGLPPRYR